MNENYASKKDLVEASGIISCFILAAAGFCALCLIPMEYCREMMIISIAVVLFQFSISNMFFNIFKLTTPRRKQRGFLWWHSGSPRTPQGLWRRVLCQSIVTSSPKPSGGRLYWRTHSMFLSTCGRHSQSSLAVYSQAALIPLFMTLIWFSMIYCSSARYIRYMASK